MDKPCHFEVPLKVAVAVDGSGWQWPPGTQPLCCIDSLPRKQSLAVLLCNGCLDLVMPLGDHIPGLNSDKLNVSMFFWRGVIIYIYSYRHRPFISFYSVETASPPRWPRLVCPSSPRFTSMAKLASST